MKVHRVWRRNRAVAVVAAGMLLASSAGGYAAAEAAGPGTSVCVLVVDSTASAARLGLGPVVATELLTTQDGGELVLLAIEGESGAREDVAVAALYYNEKAARALGPPRGPPSPSN